MPAWAEAARAFAGHVFFSVLLASVVCVLAVLAYWVVVAMYVLFVQAWRRIFRKRNLPPHPTLTHRIDCHCGRWPDGRPYTDPQCIGVARTIAAGMRRDVLR